MHLSNRKCKKQEQDAFVTGLANRADATMEHFERDALKGEVHGIGIPEIDMDDIEEPSCPDLQVDAIYGASLELG